VKFIRSRNSLDRSEQQEQLTRAACKAFDESDAVGPMVGVALNWCCPAELLLQTCVRRHTLFEQARHFGLVPLAKFVVLSGRVRIAEAVCVFGCPSAAEPEHSHTATRAGRSIQAVSLVRAIGSVEVSGGSSASVRGLGRRGVLLRESRSLFVGAASTAGLHAVVHIRLPTVGEGALPAGQSSIGILLGLIKLIAVIERAIGRLLVAGELRAAVL